ncbi:ImmA/IrrE family metallo-endopeptidase [Actinotignum sp. SLA_B059]|uniref:ImmA/IrrE family metallo-endopeptidase n=1 Tax=Actinotignum sp. SLA_B059 TaxID=3083287 RepID=UPI002A80E1D0|nr:ImmA/IrrE family metallo-endopeptidase [Actinotignum sp. SLA_B059]MDY5126615.1 ImmA/IrrE family metallo-endopeptidase [Actinotignum sp. SLA_B059]
MSNEEIARKAAAQFRQEHDLGSAPILSVTQLLERVMNVGVAFVAGAAPGHGMVMDWENKRLVAVGCTDQPMQLRSTLAHELGHLWLGHLDCHLSTSQEWGKDTPREDQADTFARNFLMPAEAVADVMQGKEPTLAGLSDLVHSYLVSPADAASQLRESGVIDQSTCEEWSNIPVSSIAAQFGWLSEYKLLDVLAQQPRAPQKLLARVIEGYRWGAIGPAAIARLTGRADYHVLLKELRAAGITPVEMPDVTATAPHDTGAESTGNP